MCALSGGDQSEDGEGDAHTANLPGARPVSRSPHSPSNSPADGGFSKTAVL